MTRWCMLIISNSSPQAAQEAILYGGKICQGINLASVANLKITNVLVTAHGLSQVGQFLDKTTVQ